MTAGLLLLAGCIPDPVDPAHPCGPYEDTPDVFAMCMSRRVHSATTTAAAAAWCDPLPRDANLRCRSDWVASAATGAVRFTGSREDLLAFCDGGPDCAFFVLDQRPEGSFSAQAAECTTWTGKMAADCIGHASERFFRGNPDDAALKRVAEGAWGAQNLRAIEKYLSCKHRTQCPDLGALTAECQEGLPNAGMLPDLVCF